MPYQSSYRSSFYNEGWSPALAWQLPWRLCRYYPNGMSTPLLIVCRPKFRRSVSDGGESHIILSFSRGHRIRLLSHFQALMDPSLCRALTSSIRPRQPSTGLPTHVQGPNDTQGPARQEGIHCDFEMPQFRQDLRKSFMGGGQMCPLIVFCCFIQGRQWTVKWKMHTCWVQRNITMTSDIWHIRSDI